MSRRRRALALVVITSIALVAVYLTLGERVTRASLSHSVASKVGQSFFGSCRATGSKTWKCAVMTTDGSGRGISYAVESSGRCWQGERLTDGGITGLPPAISGCIGLLDQLRLSDHIGSDKAARQPGFY
jgi:hypothetical protein